uniref:U22-Liphistoxin-Lm1a_1 n=1 Tax=Liphistius malayanus TaxID=1203467 RepID=A0A482Z8J8_9ARAC
MWSAAVLFLLLASRLDFARSQDETSEDAAKGDEDNTDYYSVPGEPTEDCTCVPYYQCENGKIVDDGSGIIDPRKKPQEEELPLSGKFVPPSCGPFHVCCVAPSETTVKPYEHRCGVRNPSGINSRILSPEGTGEADFGEWPWQAAVLKNEGTKHIFKCGGTLIDKRHVLTVAHCVDSLLSTPEKLTVRLGEWDTRNQN